MQLPFLKEKKWPRVAKPMEEKNVGFSPDEEIEDACIDEIWEACTNKDPKALRDALEALLLTLFEVANAVD